MTRLRYLDCAKGLGILCISFLHYENGVLSGPANTFIGTFMITIFYVVTGWLMAMKESRDTTRVLAAKRLRSLGLPYLYWTGIILAFDCILWAAGYYSSYFVAREAYKSVVLRGIGTLWFLPALFFGEIGWNWLRNKRKLWWIVALVIIMAYTHYYYVTFAHATGSTMKIVQAPFHTISNALRAVLYVASGYLCCKLYSKIQLTAFAEGCVGLGLCILAYYSVSNLHSLLGAVSWLFWPFIAPVLGPVGFILIFKSLYASRLLNFFDYWGRNSLSLMVTHYSIVQVCATIIIVNLLGLSFTGWTTIIAFICSLPIQYLITEGLNRYAPQLIRPRKK
ncbi:MAG: acyltransferase [Duncaniella sp.]|nr:acyltransferase [Duncaniella sp.]